MNNILFFINHFPSTSETFIKDEIIYFKKAGYEVSVLCHSFTETIPEVKFYKTNLSFGIFSRTIHSIKLLLSFKGLSKRVSILTMFRYGRNYYNQSLLLVGEHFIKNNHYDLIYCHFGTNGKIICQLKKAGMINRGTKIAVHFHGIDLSTNKYSPKYYNILNQICDKIIVGSDLAIEQLKKLNVYSKGKVIKVPVSLDFEKFPERINERGNIIEISTVGRLIELKGHLEALKVIKEFKRRYDNKFIYNIIGSGYLYDTLKDRIKEYGLEDEVILHGAVNHDLTIGKLYMSDIYLYCGIIDKNGREEMQGLSIIEAMASGCIIVSSTVGGVKEYLNNGNALLCSPGDITCFVQNLLCAATSKEISGSLRQNARTTAVEDFNSVKNYQLLERFLS